MAVAVAAVAALAAAAAGAGEGGGAGAGGGGGSSKCYYDHHCCYYIYIYIYIHAYIHTWIDLYYKYQGTRGKVRYATRIIFGLLALAKAFIARRTTTPQTTSCS